MTSRPTRTRVIVGATVAALLLYGAWLSHSDHDYRNNIVWFGGYAGLSGFLLACLVATTRRRYVGVVIAGVVVIGAVIGSYAWRAYVDNGPLLSSCTTSCEGGRYLAYEVFAFVYLANLFGWTVGTGLGSLMRTGGTRDVRPPSKAA